MSLQMVFFSKCLLRHVVVRVFVSFLVLILFLLVLNYSFYQLNYKLISLFPK